MKSFTHKTEKYVMFVQQTATGRWIGQLEDNIKKACDPNKLHTRTHLLDNFGTPEEALNYVGYPVDIVGIPAQLR
jgi:hypothetical protein